MHVLLIDDNKLICEYVKKKLYAKTIAVDTCIKGEDGIYKASCNDYDVIILGIILPNLNGIQVCKKLREKQINTPIIFLSAIKSTSVKIECLESGADDYIVKPFDIDELFARINCLVRRKHRSLSKVVEIKDLKIDFGTHEVKRGGKIIKLSPKEYRLLEYLINNRGKVLKRYDIMENVWGSGEKYFSNVIDVHINNLRKKIDKKHREKILKTVRDCGYLIE